MAFMIQCMLLSQMLCWLSKYSATGLFSCAAGSQIGSWTLIRWCRAGVSCEASKKFASGSGANLQLQHQKGIWCELVQSGVMLSMTRCGLGEVGPPECPTLRPSATSKRWESYRNPHRKDDALRSLLFLRPAREAALAADLIMAASK